MAGFFTDAAEAYFERVNQAPTAEALAELIADEIGQIGLSNFVIYQKAFSGSEYTASNYPVAWTEKYTREGYADIDPVFKLIRRNQRGFRWTEDLLDQQLTLTTKERSMFEDAKSFGLAEGYTFVFHGFGSHITFVSFCTDKTTAEPEVMRTASVIADAAHHRFGELQREAREEDGLVLTKREKECMYWAIQGKTDWEIGRILSIKQSTVHSHLENAKDKLGVANRVQAVIKCMDYGIVTP